MGKFYFAKESIKQLKTTGTITRTSKKTCQKMVSYLDFENADVIVELGAGDGVITKHILKKMKPNTKLIVFEVLEQFCDKLREIDDDRLIVVQDSAENLPKYLKENGFEKAHDVLSAIPFVVLEDDLAEKILKTVRDNMRKDGILVQLHYSTLAKKIYEKVFKSVKVQFFPMNIPPAFIHLCRI